MQLRPYQVDGALWLAETTRGMLADAPGLGKTPQTIAAADAVGAQRPVVICPAVATGNWRAEWQRWAKRAAVPAVYSYDRVVRDKDVQSAVRACDLLVLDEAHYLKGLDSKRTKVIYSWRRPASGLCHAPRHVWALTGTPAPNHVGEWYPHLRTLRPDLLRYPGSGGPGSVLSYLDYIRRYTHWRAGAYAIQVLGVDKRMRAELQAIIDQLALRRPVEQVLPDLPPISVGPLYVERDQVGAELRAAEDDPNVTALLAHYDRTGEFNAADLHLMTLRRLIGEAKAGPVLDQVQEELASGTYEKVVLWAWHSSVVARAAKMFGPEAVVIDGYTPQWARADVVTRFQTDPSVRVFVGQIRAAGTAITLTAAHHTIFLESSWVPDDDLQAMKRCHRYGQTQPVFARQSVLAGSVDELVMRLHQRKLQNQITPGVNHDFHVHA